MSASFFASMITTLVKDVDFKDTALKMTQNRRSFQGSSPKQPVESTKSNLNGYNLAIANLIVNVGKVCCKISIELDYALCGTMENDSTVQEKKNI